MAIFWMTKAADQGNPSHQASLGFWLLEGTFDKHAHPDPVRAIPWLERAAAQGHAGAMFMLGRVFDRGTGVPASPAEAARWYQQAIDHGSQGVEDDLGEL